MRSSLKIKFFILFLVNFLIVVFVMLKISVSDFLAENIEKNSLQRNYRISFSNLLIEKQKNINLMCFVPRYYFLHKLKNKLPINSLTYYKFFLIDLFYRGERTWWFLSVDDTNRISLYIMPYNFLLDRKDFFCFTPDARLNYVGKQGIFFYFLIEE